MIYINCPLKHDLIIELLEANKDDIRFKFIKKQGFKLTFEVDTQDLDAAIALAKKIIKASPIGRVLNFQVSK